MDIKDVIFRGCEQYQRGTCLNGYCSKSRSRCCFNCTHSKPNELGRCLNNPVEERCEGKLNIKEAK